eukprot:12896410-Prorocentrum_lima.AAC.1
MSSSSRCIVVVPSGLVASPSLLSCIMPLFPSPVSRPACTAVCAISSVFDVPDGTRDVCYPRSKRGT